MNKCPKHIGDAGSPVFTGFGAYRALAGHASGTCRFRPVFHHAWIAQDRGGFGLCRGKVLGDTVLSSPVTERTPYMYLARGDNHRASTGRTPI